jgi:hypothetical protein
MRMAQGLVEVARSEGARQATGCARRADKNRHPGPEDDAVHTRPISPRYTHARACTHTRAQSHARAQFHARARDLAGPGAVLKLWRPCSVPHAAQRSTPVHLAPSGILCTTCTSRRLSMCASLGLCLRRHWHSRRRSVSAHADECSAAPRSLPTARDSSAQQSAARRARRCAGSRSASGTSANSTRSCGCSERPVAVGQPVPCAIVPMCAAPPRPVSVVADDDALPRGPQHTA